MDKTLSYEFNGRLAVRVTEQTDPPVCCLPWRAELAREGTDLSRLVLASGVGWTRAAALADLLKDWEGLCGAAEAALALARKAGG